MSQSDPPHVLLIIDAQVNMLCEGGIPSASTTRANIERVLSAARAAQPRPVIIHVRNNGDPGDPDEPNSSGWELAVSPGPTEPVIDKHHNNAFEQTGLDVLVREDAYVTVVGMQSEYCIRATCSAALARGNKVALVRGAHATYDRAEPGQAKSAQQIERDIERELEERGVKLLELGDVTF